MKPKKEIMWNLIKNYRWKSVFFSYWKSLIYMLLIPALLFLAVVFASNVYSKKNDIKHSIISSLQKTQFTIENTFQNLDSIYYNVYTNIYTQSFILNDSQHFRGFEASNSVRRLSDLINSFVKTSAYISSVYLYSMNSDNILSIVRQSDNVTELYDSYWFKNYFKTSGNSNFILPTTYIFEGAIKQQITFSYPLRYSSELDGIMIINISLEALLPDNSEDQIYIVKDDGLILYSNNQSAIGLPISQNDKLNRFFTTYASNNTINTQVDLSQSFAGIKLKSGGASVILETSTNRFSAHLQTLITMYILYFIGVFLLIIILSFLNAFKFYHYVSDIILQSSFLNGLPLNKTTEEENNEINYISNSLLRMMNKADNIEQKLLEQTLTLQNLQFLALQSQINPHFIYNTLNLVSLIIIDSFGFKHKSTHVISLLSNILSGILDSAQYLISVSEEIDYAKKFIEIERIITDNSFDVEWFVDPKCYSMKTIKFVLQPIIENSIEHGFKNLKNIKGKLIIRVEADNDIMRFVISDNGKGMTPSDLRKLQMNAKNINFLSSNHIGYSNVHYRINILYGKDYGCQISSEIDVGTTVTITQKVIL